MSYIDDKTLLSVNNDKDNIIFILFKNIDNVISSLTIDIL